jgi:hypothetical protein
LTSQQGLLPSQQGLCAHTKESISWGSGFVDNFQGSCDSVFGDDYRVNRNCAHRQNQASAGEAVLVMIFELEETHCRRRFQSKLGLFALINPDVSCGGSLVDYFLFLHYAAFDDYYRVSRDCTRVRNRASAGEAVSAMISKSAAT